MKIVTVSSKGQITIPVAQRAKHKTNKYALEVEGDVILLKPVEIRVLTSKARKKTMPKLDDLKGFPSLGDSSFSFWNNAADDVYQNFYENS